MFYNVNLHLVDHSCYNMNFTEARRITSQLGWGILRKVFINFLSLLDVSKRRRKQFLIMVREEMKSKH